MSKTVNRERLEQILSIAEVAGDAIKDIYAQAEPVEVQKKSDDSPVTAADHAAHKIIVEKLSALTPDIPVFSEESEKITFDERQAWTSYWLVDPLDGTKEFINRTGEFTVNIALIEENEPVMGVVTVPLKDQAYVAAKEVGAFKVDSGSWSPISVRPLEANTLTVVGSRRHGAEKLDALLEQFKVDGFAVEMTSMGSSLKFCLIAEGKADIYPRLAPTCEWDTAAAQAVLMAAGGKVVNTEFQPLTYNRKESLLNPEFYALGDLSVDWEKRLKGA